MGGFALGLQALDAQCVNHGRDVHDIEVAQIVGQGDTEITQVNKLEILGNTSVNGISPSTTVQEFIKSITQLLGNLAPLRVSDNIS